MKAITKDVIKKAKDRIRNAAKSVLENVEKELLKPEVRKENTEQIKKTAKKSILEKLAENRRKVAERDAARRKTKQNHYDRDSL
ncbi:MAG: hypothetical protein Q4D60_12180 [Eubacteriales bacterium]|nr:hypothetical protein [Eubacteriales bacterium]